MTPPAPPPYTLDLTGLPLHAVRAIEAVVHAFRVQLAMAPLDPWLCDPRPPDQLSTEEWLARFDAYREHVQSRPRREGPVEIDDDRERLYDRSTD